MSPPSVTAHGTSLFILASTTIFLVVNYRNLLKAPKRGHDSVSKLPDRSQLPKTVEDWRSLLDLYDQDNNRIKKAWFLLFDLFESKYGVVLWENRNLTRQSPWPHDNMLPPANGYNTLSHNSLDKGLSRWPYWCPRSGAQHVARTKSGCDVMVRVVTAGGMGEDHKRILKFLNQTPDVLLSTNHFLPMLVEMEYEDITFAAFPKLDSTLLTAIISLVRNSVEDVLYMLLEALEGIEYLHKNHIAHQDLFFMNFVVQWQPESLIKRAVNRPRVYIIDFEDAVMFPSDTRPEEMVTTFPREINDCARPLAPEVYLHQPYSPFKMDVWQFGQELRQFNSGFAEVTQIFQDMCKDVPNERITASEALRRLDTFVRSQPPSAVDIPFTPFA